MLVESTDPLSNATGVPVDTTIQATFNEEIDTSTLTESTFYVDDGGGHLAGTISYEGLTATFTPSASLNYNYIYVVTLAEEIVSVEPGWEFNGHTWSFTTETKP